MKASLVVGEMDPSRVDVACRAVTHELIPFFQAQAGAGRAYWLVDRTTGEVLVLTTWDDADALAAVRAVDGIHRARVAGRTGLVVRSVTSMDVVESDDAALTAAPASRWARATWTGTAAPDRRAGRGAARAGAAADEGYGALPCGGCRLDDAVTAAGLAVRFWDRPPAGLARAAGWAADLQGLGVAARGRTT